MKTIAIIGMLAFAIPAPALANYPFSDAIRAGDTFYISGQIGIRPDADAIEPGGIGPETRQTMDNIGAILRAHGLGFRDVARCTVMLRNMADWGAFNEVYRGYFPDGRFPARSAFGVSALALDARVEVECTAHFPAPHRRTGSAERIK